jgi:tetratricopeptide (TPR) repeat protein
MAVRAGILTTIFCALGALSAPAQPADGPLARARAALLGGRYEEAVEEFEAAAQGNPLASRLGLARCAEARGQWDEAVVLLESAATDFDDSAPRAELARLAFERGDLEAARTWADSSLAVRSEDLLSRWIKAELDRVHGRHDDALAGYEWFIDYYNQHQPEIRSADELRWIGLAAGQFARWKRLSDQFQFLVNELYPDALKLDEGYWPAHLEMGLLFLEKYNEAEASREFKAALRLNPNSAEVYAALGALALQNYNLDDAGKLIDRALEINPRLVLAHQLRADWLTADFRVEDAIQVLEKAVAHNPVSDETLGRLAAAYGAVDGFRPAAAQRMQGVVARVEARNPNCGEFYFQIGQSLEESRRFSAAQTYFREAIKRMPQLTGPRGELGLLCMRMGEEEEARKLLEESFEIDPFNVRVKNTLEVLDVLEGYATLETEHFLIRYDASRDPILPKYAARFLEEEVYPQLCGHFGFEPEGKSLFEFFSKAKNTTAHGWFSARMVGLPSIGTVGACAGKMVAMASPNEMPGKFNWARVLKHEFVHVLNLQQTDFNIPHWYTEGLATHLEGFPRQQEWNQLLARRHQEETLFNLRTINLGFIRPQSSDDWTLAYCQAELYVQYILEQFGEDATARLLAAFADNLAALPAIGRAFSVDEADFEAGYRAFLERTIAESPSSRRPPELSLDELAEKVQQNPNDDDLAARLAVAHLGRKEYPAARKLAETVVERTPGHALSSFVLARLHLVTGDEDQALKLLEGALSNDDPNENVLALLASLKVKANDLEGAQRLYEMGVARQPDNDLWHKGLARVLLLTGNNDDLSPTLETLAQRDSDDLPYRKKLAQLALEKGDWDTARRWAQESIYADCLDPLAHEFLGRALAGAGQFGPAADEFEVAALLDEGNVRLLLEWAGACLKADRKDQARQVLTKLLAIDKENAEARRMLAEIEP